MSVQPPNITSKFIGIADKMKQTKDIVKNVSNNQKSKTDQLNKSSEDKKNFLKDQLNISPANAKSAITNAILPLLTQFINAEKSSNALLNRIVNDTKNKLKDKGSVKIINGAITFTPRNPGNYDKFKIDFENKVNRLKKIINTLKKVIDVLTSILKVLKIALIAFKVQMSLQKKRLQVQAVASATNLSAPIPSKPASAIYTIADRISQDVLKSLEAKIDGYILMIGVISSILQIFKKMLNSIKTKLDLLSLTIIQNQNNSPITQTDSSLTQLVDIINAEDELTETEYNNGEKNYIIKIII